MAFTTLISTDVLASRILDPAFAIVDCRFKLDDPAWGEQECSITHIPGAVYADLDRDLSSAKTGTNGRHPLPDARSLAAMLGRFGITSGVQVVACDQTNGMFASRLWWLLRWLGHDAVAVLDGGIAKWIAEGRATESNVERRERAPATFTGSPRADMVVDVNGVAALAGRPDWRLVDARAPERFRGDVEPLDNVAGHIPGARNHFFQGNLDERGLLRSPEELRGLLQGAIAGVPADHVVCYCGSGVTACHNLLAMEHAGMRGAKLYPGSWSEWSADSKRPVAKGD
jgi:thiosulfate/3-mercaptopyruvate sulfurtransferase